MKSEGLSWGEIVLTLRGLHLDFFNFSEINFSTFTQNIELSGRSSFPFPTVTGEFQDWDWDDREPPLQEALEMHPVERVLLEGPLLPIEVIQIDSMMQLNQMENILLNLEREWLEKLNLFTEENWNFIVENLKQRWIRVRARSGVIRLKAV